MKTTKSDDVELLCCTALTCAMFQELELVQDHNFFFPCQTCPFRWSHLARMKHNHSCLQTGVAVAASESVSPTAAPAIRAISAALNAPMFPLAPLKVADISGWMIYPWMIQPDSTVSRSLPESKHKSRRGADLIRLCRCAVVKNATTIDLSSNPIVGIEFGSNPCFFIVVFPRLADVFQCPSVR